MERQAHMSKLILGMIFATFLCEPLTATREASQGNRLRGSIAIQMHRFPSAPFSSCLSRCQSIQTNEHGTPTLILNNYFIHHELKAPRSFADKLLSSSSLIEFGPFMRTESEITGHQQIL